MKDLGYTYLQISERLQVTYRAVQYTVQAKRPTPQHKQAGRIPRLNEQEVDTLETYILSSRKARQMSYIQLAMTLFPDDNIGPASIKYALNKRGYTRYAAIKKPFISPTNQLKRLTWAREHLTWSIDEWRRILWSDETWVTAGRHRKTWITRKKGEELDPTCVIDAIRKPAGWMFWGCFHSNIKGPYIFWEKDWGSINQETYCEHTVPIVHGWMRMNPGLLFMQDHAPGHAARATQQDLMERGIIPIEWPPYSPDLNLIETVWNKMKDWLDVRYPEQKYSYEAMRDHVIEAWNAIGEDLLEDLIQSMPARCQAIIDANGLYTKY